MNSEMNYQLMHPLMLVRDLDAPIKRRRWRPRGSSRGRGRMPSQCSFSSRLQLPNFGNPDPVDPSRGRGKKRGRGRPPKSSRPSASTDPTQLAPAFSMTTRTTKKKQQLLELALSESDTECEEKDAPRFGNVRTPEKHSDDSSDSGESTLAEHLYISSDSSSSCSDETTGASSDTDDLCAPSKAAEPLAGTLKGDAYFCIYKAPDPSILEEFKHASLTEEPATLINRFKLLCRDYPLDHAGLVFTDKLRSCPIKKIITLLQSFRPLFKGTEKFFSPEMKSDIVFGSLVLTLVYHWYQKQLHQVNIKLLKLLESYHVDPLKLRRFSKTSDVPLSNLNISKETEISVICCETYFATDDMKHCVKFLNRCLGFIVEENKRNDFEHVMPLVKRVFSKLLYKKETRPLMRLFSHILDVQENLEHPIDLTLYYDGVLAIHVAKTEDRICHRQALDLFEKVNFWGYTEASGITYRGLLTVTALLNEPSFRIADVFRMCVNTGAYPEPNNSKWVISLYSSMSKIEMQFYLIQCLKGYLKNVWSGRLKMCRTYLTFQVVQVPNVTRARIHPAHPKLIQVDHSLLGAIERLKMVIYYYLNIPVDSFLQSLGDNRLVMSYDVVRELFKKVFNLDTLERDSSNCALCY